MKQVDYFKSPPALPVAVAVLALATLGLWLALKPSQPLGLRVPGTDHSPTNSPSPNTTNAVLLGQLIRSSGQPSELPGAWPGFRGQNLDGISSDTTKLARAWESSGPRQLWSLDLGEGYAGAAVRKGRVYIMDYDQQQRQDALRCLSLADGREIWRYTYPVPLKRNHGMSRTVPTVTEKHVVAMGPKCHVVCLDAETGELRWGLDLARQFGVTVPEWYAGQCPLIEDNRVILGVGGKEALMIAVDCETGRVLWQTPNPKKWRMTHSSVVPMEVAGRRTYVYCAALGVVGVSAADGALLWDTTDWKISMATIPSPVILEEGRIFLSGGYGAGSLMLQVQHEGDRFVPKTLFRLEPKIFGATQHTPIYYEKHLFGVRPDGQFVCLDLNGKVVWASGSSHQFGLGPFMIADGVIFAMNDAGKLTLIQATPEQFQALAEAQVLNGRESWGPLALAGGRLLARDFTKMICMDVRAR